MKLGQIAHLNYMGLHHCDASYGRRIPNDKLEALKGFRFCLDFGLIQGKLALAFKS